MTRLMPLIVFTALCLGAGPGFANDQARLAGAWTLISYEVEQQATGLREPVLGQHPSGSIIFTPEGRMMVVLTGEGRKPPATDQDRAELLTSLVAYTGMYRLEGQKWITTVDVSANPAWVGGEQTRFFKFDGDRLQESTGWTHWPAHPDMGAVRFVLTWECAQ
jgi:hypothetical protein